MHIFVRWWWKSIRRWWPPSDTACCLFTGITGMRLLRDCRCEPLCVLANYLLCLIIIHTHRTLPGDPGQTDNTSCESPEREREYGVGNIDEHHSAIMILSFRVWATKWEQLWSLKVRLRRDRCRVEQSVDPAREIQMNWLECEEAGDGMVQFYHF